MRSGIAKRRSPEAGTLPAVWNELERSTEQLEGVLRERGEGSGEGRGMRTHPATENLIDGGRLFEGRLVNDGLAHLLHEHHEGVQRLLDVQARAPGSSRATARSGGIALPARPGTRPGPSRADSASLLPLYRLLSANIFKRPPQSLTRYPMNPDRGRNFCHSRADSSRTVWEYFYRRVTLLGLRYLTRVVKTARFFLTG